MVNLIILGEICEISHLTCSSPILLANSEFSPVEKPKNFRNLRVFLGRGAKQTAPARRSGDNGAAGGVGSSLELPPAARSVQGWTWRTLGYVEVSISLGVANVDSSYMVNDG